MCPEKMHVDQLDIDEPLVRRLLAGQFPYWADLSIARVKSDGTENAIYRLGDDLAIRLPYRFVNTTQVDKDHRWLPLLSPHLPLPIPVPVAKGAPAEGYPSQWSVCRWLPGENTTLDRLTDLSQAAKDPREVHPHFTADRFCGWPRSRRPQLLSWHSTGRSGRLHACGHRRIRRLGRFRRCNRRMGTRPPGTGVERVTSLDPRRPRARQPAGTEWPTQRGHRLGRPGCWRSRYRVAPCLELVSA